MHKHPDAQVCVFSLRETGSAQLGFEFPNNMTHFWTVDIAGVASKLLTEV